MYKLQLSVGIRIHDTFHVFQLKKVSQKFGGEVGTGLLLGDQGEGARELGSSNGEMIQSSKCAHQMAWC